MSEMIIDAHVHPFLVDEQNMGFRFYGRSQTPRQFADSLRRAGISRFAGSVILQSASFHSFADIRRLNRAALELRERFGDTYVPGVHIHPDFPKESCEEIERFHRLGGWLIGELVPYQMGYESYLQGGAREIFGLAQELRMAVCIHPSTEDDIAALAAAFPRLPIIVAHPGEKQTFSKRLDMMKAYPNLYQDLSGTGLFRNGLVRYGLDRVGKDRLLFGTDYPICNPGMYVAAVQYEDLTDSEREAVFSRNFLELESLAGACAGN